ncbi:mucolipin-1-like, partial [Heptranchias perlo]|uniref:mucolipin-1-like n=1 Tax=Heptranchias perlo TaxID=212740 RepID=UPI0035597A40
VVQMLTLAEQFHRIHYPSVLCPSDNSSRVTLEDNQGFLTMAGQGSDAPQAIRTFTGNYFLLILFGLSNQMMVDFTEENTMTFKHLFLKDYTDVSDDSYAVYTQKDVYDSIFYAVEQYLALQNMSLGRYAYGFEGDNNGTALQLCQRFYKKGSINPANDTFNINPQVVTECVSVSPSTHVYPREIQILRNFTLKFYKLINVSIRFKLK